MVKLIVKQLLRRFGRTRCKGYTLATQKYKPMLRLLDGLEQRGVDVASLDALEMFGSDGLDHTTTYGDRVRTLEVWEIDEAHHPRLRENLPGVSIRFIDSYEEVARTERRFDLIVVDPPVGIYGTHCDHFGLFPDKIFSIARDECVLVLNVIPRIERVTLKHFPYLMSEDYLKQRKQFYGASDAMNITMDDNVGVYRSFVERSGFRLVWSFHLKRGAGVEYLVLGIRK